MLNLTILQLILRLILLLLLLLQLTVNEEQKDGSLDVVVGV